MAEYYNLIIGLLLNLLALTLTLLILLILTSMCDFKMSELLGHSELKVYVGTATVIQWLSLLNDGCLVFL
jgi:hypothetical protein